MANQEHLEMLKQGIEQWNKWRKENEAISPDLEDADLRGADLGGADLSYADLRGAELRKANLRGANLHDANLLDADLSVTKLSGADLSEAFLVGAHLVYADLHQANLREADLKGANLTQTDLSETDLMGADLSEADLWYAKLSGADLSEANLSDANLKGADLSETNLSKANLSSADLNRANLTNCDLTGAYLVLANLVETNFTDATITGCSIYGVSAWNVILEGTDQNNLIISKEGEPVVTVDNLEVGQFIYLMLNNAKIRDVINTITSKGVLILGRFSDPQRKSVLDGLKEKLREFDLLPMVFDFDCPTDKDYTETVQTLASMSMFVIADLTNPKSTPLELEATVKQFKVPYIPIIDTSVDPRPFAMLVDSQKSFHWVLPTVGYPSKDVLLDDENLKTYVIDRANAKREELRQAKNQEPEMIIIRKKEVIASPS
jgi:uncharacterized protein YjbI with pentapeptide repeats